MGASIGILGLGVVAVDDLLAVDRYPPPDTKEEVKARDRQCGGLTATALVAAARLGSRCAYAGTLGDDELSLFVEESLAREGIDLSHLVRDAKARPVHSIVVVDRTRKTRTIFYHLGGFAGAHPSLPGEEAIRSARVLFVDSYGMEGMIRAARIARAARIPVVADIERSDFPRFQEILDLADHLIVSEEFAASFTGERDPAAGALALWGPGRQVVSVTAGAEGSWHVAAEDPGKPVHQPAFPVDVVDTTGCGDVFHGAYAAALEQGLPVRERFRIASAAAAIKATRPGGQAGIPTRPAVERFLEERKA